ncbi:phospholipid/cholesterol/gamma-HCH transport system permease protein [Mycobacterium sp. MAA66]|uniref:ABC transporter permease n=1 Tax=Mycobacterium sp. MAA66 TaxID=3156297 RepID=UPI00351135C1
MLEAADSAVLPVAKAGHFMHFFVAVIASVPVALGRYRKEFLRLLADISWGNGSIVVGGGTVGVALVLGVTAGALIGVEGYNALNLLGLGSVTGLLSAFASTRDLAPIMLGVAFATQAGCRFTAQLGAMRINEEVDALEAIAIKPIPYLASTRVVASAVAAVPLLLVCLSVTYLSCQLVVALSGNNSPGTYMHYFSLFINPTDVLYSISKGVSFVVVASTIQCYFGYFASGGPAGVGVAAGHAMRAAIVAIVVLNMFMTMGLWGIDNGARLGG